MHEVGMSMSFEMKWLENGTSSYCVVFHSGILRFGILIMVSDGLRNGVYE